MQDKTAYLSFVETLANACRLRERVKLRTKADFGNGVKRVAEHEALHIHSRSLLLVLAKDVAENT